MNEIISNLNQIKKRISSACEKAGRNTNEVRLLNSRNLISLLPLAMICMSLGNAQQNPNFDNTNIEGVQKLNVIDWLLQ